MPARLKTTTAAITSRNQFNALIDEIAALQLEVEEATSTLNTELAKLQEGAKTVITAKQAAITFKLAAAEKYAETERDTLFPGKEKTAATALAKFGFRLTPPAVKPLSSAWPAARSIEAIESAGQPQFLTVKTMLNKDVLKGELDDAGLAAFGLRLTSKDEFWIEPVRTFETADSRLTA